MERDVVFSDRAHGGEVLAASLEPYRARAAVVVALARGGVPVAVEVASRLGIPLEVIVARRITAPSSPQHVLGVAVEGGSVFMSAGAAHERGVGREQVAALAKEALEDAERRGAVYRGGAALPELAGRTALLVDDGVASGATARAACCALRRRGAARVVLAAPVIAAASEPDLHAVFDDVVAVERPLEVPAVSAWYEAYPQLSDEDVVACLHGAPADDHESRFAADPWDDDWIGGWMPDERETLP